jgi:hypothetical protein
MRAIVLALACPLLSGCTATLLYEPRILVSPYLAVYQLRGDIGLQSDPGGGAPPVDNAPQTMRTFGQDSHKEDLGVRADIGDGFAGLRLDYYQLDMGTSHPGVLEDDWGSLLQGESVRMKAKMNEFRLAYLEPLLATKGSYRERPIEFRLAAGGVLAYRDMALRAMTDDGVGRQNVDIEGSVAYGALRGRVTWFDVAFDLDYAVSPGLTLGGDWDGLQQDIELRASYTLPMRDVTFFGGWRYSTLEATGTMSGLEYDADLGIDGFQLGVTFSF